MKRQAAFFAPLLLIGLLLSGSALSQPVINGGSSSSSGPAVAHTGNGATRQYMNNGSSGALQNAMSRGMFFWRNETTTGPTVQVSPCRVSSTGDETCYAATTFKVSVYDAVAGTSTLCGTSAAVAVPTTVACPNVTLIQGHQYAVCQYVSSVNGINLYQSMLANGLSTLDGVAFGTTGSPATDNTASCGSVPDGSGSHNQSVFAVGVLSSTLQPSPCTITDSRGVGNAAVFDQSADLGDFHPSIGQKYGYIQLGAAGIFINPTSGYLHGHAARDIIIAAACTTIIDELGVNDMSTNASTAATVAGWHTTLAALYPTKYIVGSTMMPVTSSSDSWATNFYSGSNNQTCSGNGCTIPKSFNTLARAGISGEATYWDTMRTFDPALTGFWCINWLPGSATGSASFCTTDGIHPTANAMILEKSSGWIDLNSIQ